MLDCCEPLEKVKARGISLGKLVCLANCAGAKVQAFRTNQSTIDDFRKYLHRCSTSDDCHIISSYHRAAFKQVSIDIFNIFFSRISLISLAKVLCQYTIIIKETYWIITVGNECFDNLCETFWVFLRYLECYRHIKDLWETKSFESSVYFEIMNLLICMLARIVVHNQPIELLHIFSNLTNSLLTMLIWLYNSCS